MNLSQKGKMIQYAPKQLSKKLQQNNINSLNQIQRQKANKYSQTLKFMTEWSNDLLEREHEFTTNQQQLNHQRVEIETKSKTFRSQKTQQSMRHNTSSQIDIQKMIEQEFIKKLEQVYKKQILLYESQPHNQTFNSEEPSQHHESVQSHQSSQSHQRLSSNFSNYFNGYQCHTETKNNEQSVGSENLSKASELIQQQYFSNQVEEQPEYQEDLYHNSKHHETYEENFISY